MPPYLREVRSRRDLRKFIDFPLKLYRNNPYYVPQMRSGVLGTLDPEKNPAFEYCEARYWLAFEGRKVVGRVAAIINRRHADKWDQSYMRYGWLDFIDDPQVSKLLMDVVESWAREKGLAAVHGPLGFTNMDREGMLIEGFEECATMATLYNYAYYPEHLAKLGYVKEKDWVEYELKMPDRMDERIARASSIVLKRNNLHLLETNDKKDLLKYAPQLFGLVNREYSKLYAAVALTDAEIKHYTKTYFTFVEPDFVPIILDDNDQMVAFGVTIPSLSGALQKSRGCLFPFGWWPLIQALRKNERADLYLIAVDSRYRGMGVNMVLMNKAFETFKRRGIQWVESNPELEDNRNVQSQWKSFEKRQHKRRRCVIKML